MRAQVRVRSFDAPRERPWSTVVRVETDAGVVWFKACGPTQAFEPLLTEQLCTRWPDRVPELLACDTTRAWLLLADAGTQLRELGNPPELWLDILPRYAELQRGEATHARSHLAQGVPDLRVAVLPSRYELLLGADLPLDDDEMGRLRRFGPQFAQLCQTLAEHDTPDTVQHDDLHLTNVYVREGARRVLDWGDASIGHPFASLVVTFRFLEESNGLAPDDPWFARLRDAYLEPWGRDLKDTFDLAMRVGAFAHAIAQIRQRDALAADARPGFDHNTSIVLRRALTRIDG